MILILYQDIIIYYKCKKKEHEFSQVRTLMLNRQFSFRKSGGLDTFKRKSRCYLKIAPCLTIGISAVKNGFVTPVFCAVGGLTDFAFACLLQKQIELNVG